MTGNFFQSRRSIFNAASFFEKPQKGEKESSGMEGWATWKIIVAALDRNLLLNNFFGVV